MPESVVVVGAGLAGLATAVAAAEKGHSVVVLEKASQVGGAAAYSGGQVWVAANHVQRAQGIEDSVVDGERYVRSTGSSDPELIDDQALHRWMSQGPRAAEWFESIGAVRWTVIPDYPDYYQDAPGARLAGRYLTATFDGADLGEWRDRLRVSPHFPVGTTYDELLGAGLRASAFGAAAEAAELADQDLLSFGTGVVAGFLAAAVARGVDIRLGHSVVALDVEDGRVAGVSAEIPSGETASFRGHVVLATSGYDWDDELALRYLGLSPDQRGSVAPRSISGDGIRLAQQAGAELFVVPANRVPIQLGYPTQSEPGFAVAREHSLPHTFIVGPDGRRFADDAVYWEVVKHALDPETPRLPCWMIWDEQHHRKYGLGATPPGGNYPVGLVETAATVDELADLIGVPATNLVDTTARFNEAIAGGDEPEFGRGRNLTWQRFQGDPHQGLHPNLGSVSEPPYFALRLRMVSTGIGLTGVSIDPDGRVISERGEPIPGLYAAGAVAAFNSSGVSYNSGYSLSRAITLGLLVAEQIDTESVSAKSTNRTELKRKS